MASENDIVEISNRPETKKTSMLETDQLLSCIGKLHQNYIGSLYKTITGTQVEERWKMLQHSKQSIHHRIKASNVQLQAKGCKHIFCTESSRFSTHITYRSWFGTCFFRNSLIFTTCNHQALRLQVQVQASARLMLMDPCRSQAPRQEGHGSKWFSFSD